MFNLGSNTTPREAAAIIATVIPLAVALMLGSVYVVDFIA